MAKHKAPDAPGDKTLTGIGEEYEKLSEQRKQLDAAECALIETARDNGASWADLAEALGFGTKQALQQRYKRIGGQRNWPTRKPFNGLASGIPWGEIPGPDPDREKWAPDSSYDPEKGRYTR
ncbi:hypothetical protein [Rhodococcus erythropolis]|uniref:Uncharacterized protein n=1 Tax=Rhodococcus erythropolis (strain PR4 / NBRC 100887) TaxID=234621 RepID=Q3L8Y0_RHOE4|nr:hypothetical protein [Rhodococcus erythropolis]BAE46333.1 hypothetical protein RER_pREC1-00920 [Rhodococcus erythropolis PR4]